MGTSAGITVSVDGYYVGPDDGPGRGLGVGGERLHHWVFGGPWTYSGGPRGEPTGVDADFLAEAGERAGAVVCGRRTYESAGAWGGSNPFGVPLLVLTHRVEDQPADSAGFTFVPDLDTALDRARAVAGDKDVHVMGGGDVIRQALAAGVVDELVISVAPVLLGAGKRLFERLEAPLELERTGIWPSDWAVHTAYRVLRP